ncbi:MAG: hypothetical protein R2828_10310 [Saprospiraceae bacterium]
MKKIALLILSLMCVQLYGQSAAEKAPLPDKFADLPQRIQVHHFPSPVMASTDAAEPGIYFWKHNTSIFSPDSDATIVEGGAYIFYNDQWNHRVTYTAKEFAAFFGVPNGKMKAGEPYTFTDNWRRDSRLLGGWALWYIIVELPSGDRACGFEKLDTVGDLYGQ